MRKKKVLFVHGRSPNPVHIKYAESIGADKIPGDFIIKWQDFENPSKLRVISSWILSALGLYFKRYDIIITESFREPVMLLKLANLLSKESKVILMLTNETTYMLKTKKLSSFTTKFYEKFLFRVDGIICIGEMIHAILLEMNIKKPPPIKVIFNGIDPERFFSLEKLTINLNSKNILVIANGSSYHRVFCKGIDIMIEAFALLWQKENASKLFIIGQWDDHVQKELLKGISSSTKNAIHFVGFVKDIESYLLNCSLYLHIARGESWGISVLEAMRAGLIPIVSEWTGAKEVVSQVSVNLIVPLNPKHIAEAAENILNMEYQKKIDLSNKCKIMTNKYDEAKAIERFKSAYGEIII